MCIHPQCQAPCEKYRPTKRSFSLSSFNTEVIHQGLKYIFHGSDWSECNFCISFLKSRFLSLARYWRGTKSNSSVKVWTVFHYFLGCHVICWAWSLLVDWVLSSPLSYWKSWLLKRTTGYLQEALLNWIQCYSPGVMLLSWAETFSSTGRDLQHYRLRK